MGTKMLTRCIVSKWYRFKSGCYCAPLVEAWNMWCQGLREALEVDPWSDSATDDTEVAYVVMQEALHHMSKANEKKREMRGQELKNQDQCIVWQAIGATRGSQTNRRSRRAPKRRMFKAIEHDNDVDDDDDEDNE
jgi:hypothetical protein